MAGAPQALDANHPLEGFDCGKPALNDWLVRHARQAQASGSAKSTHPIDGEASRFYQRFGFEASPAREQQLLLLLKDARRLLSSLSTSVPTSAPGKAGPSKLGKG